jgi:hypothetical protein
MRRIALVLAFLTALTAPAFAQKAEIDAVNAKWVEFFNEGDFAGVASLYTEDATAFQPEDQGPKCRNKSLASTWSSGRRSAETGSLQPISGTMASSRTSLLLRPRRNIWGAQRVWGFYLVNPAERLSHKLAAGWLTWCVEID